MSHRCLAAIVAAVLFAPADGRAQQAPTAENSLPTGAHVRFWSHDVAGAGWLEGTVIRFFPNGGGECLGIHSNALTGFNSIQRIDSLVVSDNATPPHWRKLPVAPLRAREKGCVAQPLHK